MSVKGLCMVIPMTVTNMINIKKIHLVIRAMYYKGDKIGRKLTIYNYIKMDPNTD